MYGIWLDQRPKALYLIKNMMTKTYCMTRRSRTGFSFIGAMSMIMLLTMGTTPQVKAETATKAPVVVEPVSKLEEALKKLKLPGVEINLKERCVDVDAFICLDEGALELIACIKDSKEHESIIAVEAMPKNIHTALLLIGAKSGNPAMQKPANEEKTRWIHVPPKGGPVDISIVFKNKHGKQEERPISDFLEPFDGERYDGHDEEKDSDDKKKESFPTNTFLFAGSFLHGKGEGPRTYVADRSGHVISLATFGDELLCLPGIHAHTAGALAWQINSTHLPDLGTKVTLRLRPKNATIPDAGKEPIK